MTDRSAVAKELEGQGLEVRAVQPELWVCSYDVEGTKQEVLLFMSEGSGYFVAVSPIVSPELESKPSGLTQRTLAALVELGSSVPLAKIDFKAVGDDVMYAALSYCSAVGWSGEKLNKRMRDVAILATRVENTLGRPSPKSVAR